ncbi:UNVERIFIED_ORG: hypothetical protein J2W82_000692 [Pseudomonas mohnii]|nr:hypothetical protein [Pseudomonas mohnii]
MSWLFSQALVAEYSAATSWDGAPSAPMSVMPTQHKFWRNDKTMEPSKLSQFGLTCAALTEDRGEALLTWFRADSRVRTYQLPGMAPASRARGLGSGVKWRESSAKYDLKSSSWKTHLCLWEEDLPWSSVTLPKWGMTRSGALFQHPTSERPINAIGVGLWPTITVHGNHNPPRQQQERWLGLERSSEAMANARETRLPASREEPAGTNRQQIRRVSTSGSRWPIEPGVGRMADGVACRLDRIKALGNAQVPRVAAAFTILSIDD